MEDESSGSIPTVDVAQAVDVVWTFVCFVLVLLMQAGFACYEVGTIRAVSSTQHILLKNIGDAVVGLAAWYLVGHSIAVGTDVLGVFGKPKNLSAQTSEEGIALLFLEFLYLGAFATTCTTIVSEIEDPLYEVDIDVDKGDPADRSQREARQQAQLSRETFAKIRKYQDEHPGSLDNPSKENVFKWPHPKFKWPFSTHKNLHGAAINGILADLFVDAIVEKVVCTSTGGREGSSGLLQVVVCTWVLWGVFGILKLVKLAQAGKVVDKAELEGISKLKDDLIRRDLAMQRQMGEKEEKIEFQLDQLANRVEDLDTHRLNDVEASLLARVKDIAGLVERLEQLENAGRNTSTSTLRQAAMVPRIRSRWEVVWRLPLWRLYSTMAGPAQDQTVKQGVTPGRMVMIAGLRAAALAAGMGALLSTSLSIFAMVYGRSAFKGGEDLGEHTADFLEVDPDLPSTSPVNDRGCAANPWKTPKRTPAAEVLSSKKGSIAGRAQSSYSGRASSSNADARNSDIERDSRKTGPTADGTEMGREETYTDTTVVSSAAVAEADEITLSPDVDQGGDDGVGEGGAILDSDVSREPFEGHQDDVQIECAWLSVGGLLWETSATKANTMVEWAVEFLLDAGASCSGVCSADPIDYLLAPVNGTECPVLEAVFRQVQRKDEGKEEDPREWEEDEGEEEQEDGEPDEEEGGGGTMRHTEENQQHEVGDKNKRMDRQNEETPATPSLLTTTADKQPENLKPAAHLDHELVGEAEVIATATPASSSAHAAVNKPDKHKTTNVGSVSGAIVATTTSFSSAPNNGVKAASRGSSRLSTVDPEAAHSVVLSKHTTEPVTTASHSTAPGKGDLSFGMICLHAAVALMMVIVGFYSLKRRRHILGRLCEMRSFIVSWVNRTIPRIATWLRVRRRIIWGSRLQASMVVMACLHRALSTAILWLNIAAWVARAPLVAISARIERRRILMERRAQRAAVWMEASAASVEPTTSNLGAVTYSPLGSFFSPPLSKEGLISLVAYIDYKAEVSWLAEAVRLGFIGLVSFNWLMEALCSIDGTKILKDRNIVYNGPLPPSRYKSIDDYPYFCTRKGITALIQLICQKSAAGDDFFVCASSATEDAWPRVIAGRVLASEDTSTDADPATVPRRRAVIFKASEQRAGRPAIDADRVNGAGAHVLTDFEWFMLFGDCEGCELYAWVYGRKFEGQK
eukprot:g12987.t1